MRGPRPPLPPRADDPPLEELTEEHLGALLATPDDGEPRTPARGGKRLWHQLHTLKLVSPVERTGFGGYRFRRTTEGTALLRAKGLL